MMIQLQAMGVVFGYNSSRILDDVSLEIPPGKLVSVVGPNGSGKSTLIKCLDRVLSPQGGKVLIDRQDISKMTRKEVAKNLAYVPQSSLRVFPTTVYDTVLMGRRPHIGWLASTDDDEKVWNVLQLLGIEHLAMEAFTELSGGQQQKVLIARALVQESKVMLLDEPTSNLDIWHQLDVMGIVRNLVQSRGITAMLAVHDLNLASRFSDRIIMMKRGKIVSAGPPSVVLTPENIAQVYNVEAEVRNNCDTPYIMPLCQIRDGGSKRAPPASRRRVQSHGILARFAHSSR
ncbi:MAG: ABC transporter ATP-binding protein [Methanotrichaceae archaeon]|nr:ABC transporter ATP-binding protein [Methanotrichaceae archaeon]